MAYDYVLTSTGQRGKGSFRHWFHGLGMARIRKNFQRILSINLQIIIRGTGGHECGEQWYFVPRGYVQVIPDIRGVGKSEGDITFDWGKDGYDLIEWIAEQPWCNGNVGMIGMSAFAMAQYMIAG